MDKRLEILSVLNLDLLVKSLFFVMFIELC